MNTITAFKNLNLRDAQKIESRGRKHQVQKLLSCKFTIGIIKLWHRHVTNIKSAGLHF